MLKTIDGGFPEAGLFDFIIMLWIGALLGIFVPQLTANLLPDFATTFGAPPV
jgi:hypothetical protein